MVGGHIVDQRVDPWTIFLPKEVEGPSIAVLGPANQRFIVGQVLVVHSTSTLQIADQTPNEQRKKGKREGKGTYRRVGVSAYRRLNAKLRTVNAERQCTTPVSTRRFFAQADSLCPGSTGISCPKLTVWMRAGGTPRERR